MAKINHSNYLDVVNSVWSAAKEQGVMHINSQENSFDGSSFKIKGRELKNFGICGYLGLEKHPKMIEGSIDLIKKYGTQLSMSRAYIRPPYIQELEDAMVYHLPLAIEQEGDIAERVYNEFGFTYKGVKKEKRISSNLIVEEYSTINEIDSVIWNSALKDRGNITIPKYAYLELDDMHNMEIINSFSND